MVRSLPLRTGFFAEPALTADDERELLAWGRSLVPDLLARRRPEASTGADGADWTLVHEKKGVQLMEDRQKGGLTYSVRATATVHAPLEDVMDLFLGRAAATTDFRALMMLQLRESFADAAVLAHREPSESETLGIKWVAARPKKSAAGGVGGAAGVDLCLLEYAALVDAATGSPIDPLLTGTTSLALTASGAAATPAQVAGVCLYESLEQRECPPLYDSHRLERGAVSRCGFVFTPLATQGQGPAAVEALFVCSIRQPPGQRGPRRANRALLAHWAEAVGSIGEAISRARISRELAKRKTGPRWVHDKDRACCRLCLKTFTNTRRRHHCRACGEVICRACSRFRAVDLQSVGQTTLRVCKACMDGTNKPLTDDEAEPDKADKPVADKPVPANVQGQKQTLALPAGVTDETLRDAVEEYALALPGAAAAAAAGNSSSLALTTRNKAAEAPAVPDLVGIAWLRQLAERDPSKREMVAELMDKLRRETEANFGAQFDAHGAGGEQVDIYDTLCDLAAQALSCKYAVVSLVDENRQWFKSAVNVQESQVPRDFSFCEYPVRDQRPLVVMDTLRDPRFSAHPFVTGPLAVRFLAGAPLFTVDDECVGAVCVLDTEPRAELQESQIATMQNLAHLAMVMVQERREAQSRLARATANVHAASQQQQLVPRGYAYGGAAPVSAAASATGKPSSDLVPLSSYRAGEGAMVVQQQQQQPSKEDPALKEQMIQLLQKASQVRDQVNQQSTAQQQQAGLQSSAE